MEGAALLAELRALADNAPNLTAYKPASRVHHEWLGKLYALIRQWDPSHARDFLDWTDSLNNIYTRDVSSARLLSLLYRAIGNLEIEIPAQAGQVFGPGAAYNFFKTLRDLLASAKQSVLIVDPYLDDTVFDAYLTAISSHVSVRLLTRKYAAALKPAVARFVAQNQSKIEARKSDSIHDRVLFLDDLSCWVLGQSIKDAANTKPTYLAPLDAEMTALKKADYEIIWTAATPI